MAQRQQRPATGDLEGLILSDGSGAFYEVPTAVIARYRVPAEEASRLGHGGPPPGAADVHRPGWTVCGAVYTPRAPGFWLRAGRAG